MQGAFQLRAAYPDNHPPGHPRFLTNFETKVFSQNGEDGILQYLFHEIGTATKRFVEFGVEDGRECNSAYLAIDRDWEGLLLDGSQANVNKGRAFYRAMMPHRPTAVRFEQAWITRENINELIRTHGWTEIDLLSIDVDGNDYWIWEAIDVVSPRVVVVEFNASFGLRPVTVPYDPTFVRWEKHSSGYYHGASLTALNVLAQRRGYTLVGCESTGVNAFFVRDDLLKPPLAGVRAEDAYTPIRVRAFQGVSTDEQFTAVAHLPFESVK